MLGLGLDHVVEAIQDRSDEMQSVMVTDSAIIRTRQLLWDQLQVVSEPGGATAAAALLSGAYHPKPGERVAAIVCGANTDPSDLVARGETRQPLT